MQGIFLLLILCGKTDGYAVGKSPWAQVHADFSIYGTFLLLFISLSIACESTF